MGDIGGRQVRFEVLPGTPSGRAVPDEPAQPAVTRRAPDSGDERRDDARTEPARP